MARSRRQHFVARFYLRNFAEPMFGEHIWVYYHPDWFDSAYCEVEAPEAYLGQKFQIWGWNRQGGPLDKRFHERDAVVHISCDPSKRSPASWGGPTGFGQWEITLLDSPAS